MATVAMLAIAAPVQEPTLYPAAVWARYRRRPSPQCGCQRWYQSGRRVVLVVMAMAQQPLLARQNNSHHAALCASFLEATTMRAAEGVQAEVGVTTPALAAAAAALAVAAAGAHALRRPAHPTVRRYPPHCPAPLPPMPPSLLRVNLLSARHGMPALLPSPPTLLTPLSIPLKRVVAVRVTRWTSVLLRVYHHSGRRQADRRRLIAAGMHHSVAVHRRRHCCCCCGRFSGNRNFSVFLFPNASGRLRLLHRQETTSPGCLRIRRAPGSTTGCPPTSRQYRNRSRHRRCCHRRCCGRSFARVLRSTNASTEWLPRV